MSEEKRKTVSVRSSRPMQLRLYRKPTGDDRPMMPDPDYAPVELRGGATPGVDAEFFAKWLEQNKQMAESLGVSAEDEDDNPESAERKE